MSYGMHNYLADKAKQNTYMQKKAAAKNPWEAAPEPGEPTNTEIDKEHWAAVNKKRGVEEPSWLQSRMADARDVYALGKAKAGEYYSRARAFVAKHPEILYGLGGAGIGAGIGALVSPKRRLLGTLIGLGLGGALGAGGKMAWDRWGGDVLSTLGKPVYRRVGDGLTPNERKEKKYQDEVIMPAAVSAAYSKGGDAPNNPYREFLRDRAVAGDFEALKALNKIER